MKTLLKLTLCMITVLSLAACGTNNQKKTLVNEPSSITPTHNPQAPAADSKTLYFGTVKSIVGNEVELSLAEIPEFLKERENEKDGKENGPAGGTKPGEGSGGVTDIPEGADRSDTAADTSSDGSAASLSSALEYTGETKVFTLPAGIEIKDNTGGKGGLSSIHKMSVLKIVTDQEGQVSLCEIWE